jgi:hypothetical protein
LILIEEGLLKSRLRLAATGLLAAWAQPAAAQGQAALAQLQNAGQPRSADSTVAVVSAGAASTLRRDDARVGAVAYRLALAGRSQCSEAFPLTGMLFHHLAEYEPADRRLMISRYRLDRGPGVLTVLAGSPAAAAGLVAGDVLLTVNGRPFPSPAVAAGEERRKAMRKMLEASEAQLEQALRAGPAELKVLRAGRELPVTLGSVRGCVGRVRLARSTQMNAFSLRGYVVMTTAMLGYVRSDDELAVVLGHELSHSILGHEGMRNDEGLLESLGFKPSAIWRREEQADRFGLRLMAAAGYDLDAAVPFWHRYLGQYDWFPQIFRSHPSRGSREKIARQEIEAIRRGDPMPARP